MPTNTNAYNSRVTDEALEKRFRDTFRSQGGAELVDDLYAQGVIVPVVDFTQAATGDVLAQNLQTAWDFSTGSAITGTTAGTTTIISNSGFWQVDVTAVGIVTSSGGTAFSADLEIYDGATAKQVYGYQVLTGAAGTETGIDAESMVVFLRSGDILRANHVGTNVIKLNIVYRQIATVNGDLVNPSGFTSS